MSYQLYETKPNINKLFIYSSSKVIFIVALGVGFIIYTNTLIDFDMMGDAFETMGIKLPAIDNFFLYLNIAVVLFLLLYLVYNYFSLGDTRLIFFDDKLIFNKKGFLTTKKIEILYRNISKVNFEESSIFKSGDLILDLSGLKEKSVKIQFIDHTQQICTYTKGLVDRHKAGYYSRLQTKDI